MGMGSEVRLEDWKRLSRVESTRLCFVTSHIEPSIPRHSARSAPPQKPSPSKLCVRRLKSTKGICDANESQQTLVLPSIS